MRRTCLITGSGGFIGRHLVNRLTADGDAVIGVDLHHRPYEDKHLHFDFRALSDDFRNLELMEKILRGVDVVFHLASAHLQVNIPASEYWNINVYSLWPLLQAASRLGVKRFVHVSSVGVYGNLETRIADEETPCKPQNIYGESKLAGEIEVKKYYEETHFPIVILRPAWVYGPGCQRTLKLYRTLQKKRFVMVGNGRNLRHPIYIRDMVDALILAGQSDSAVGETIVIGGDQAVSTEHLVNAFCSILNLPKPKIKLPMKLGEFVGGGLEKVFSLIGKEPPLSKRSLEFFNTTNAFDISKARKLLGFNPSFTIEDGLKEARVWLERSVSKKNRKKKS